MNILVTGGAGFIGSNFILYMAERYPGYRIVNIDALTYAGNLENLDAVKDASNYKFVLGSVTDAALIERLLEEESIEVVVHFAAESHVDRSIADPGVFVKTNVSGTQVPLDAARKRNVKKFVQISTDEVYGSLGESGLFTETTPLSPRSPYSASKAGADLLILAYHETYGMNVNITRCSNNYGPFHFPEKLIPLIITNALHDLPLPVYGDGLHIRDWLYVEDHCRAIDLVVHHGVSGEVYNIGGNNELTNIEIVKTVLKELGKLETLIRYVPDRPGHDRRYGIDASKIRRELHWKPEYDLETGLRKTIQWYIDNEAWWQRIKNGTYKEYYEKQYGSKLGDPQ
jgi:dTDP-glucose 4,6-dehydratase